jgi:hypothetical protein
MQSENIMAYKVTRQYSRGPETTLQTFKTLEEAKAFAQEKLSADAGMGVKSLYRIYDVIDELLEELDSTNIASTATLESSSGTAGGAGKGANFRPSPLSTTARPRGMPQHWSKDDDKKDK